MALPFIVGALGLLTYMLDPVVANSNLREYASTAQSDRY
jgi:hypothetical protein